jgi:hypothetical protein
MKHRLVAFSLVAACSAAGHAESLSIGGIQTIAPCRLVRTDVVSPTAYPFPYGGGAPFSAEEVRTFTVAGAGLPAGNPCSGRIPGHVSGIVATVTAKDPLAAGNVQSWPEVAPAVATSILNFRAGVNIANSTILAVVANQLKVKVALSQTHLIVDVLGYVAADVGQSGGSGYNTFLGEDAGNDAVGGVANTGLGSGALDQTPSSRRNSPSRSTSWRV